LSPNRCGVFGCKFLDIDNRICINLDEIKKGCSLVKLLDMNPNIVYIMMNSKDPCYVKDGKVFKISFKEEI